MHHNINIPISFRFLVYQHRKLIEILMGKNFELELFNQNGLRILIFKFLHQN